MAYTLELELEQRRAEAAFFAAVVAKSMGSDVEVPDPGDTQRLFNEALAEEPKEASTHDRVDREIRAALGL